MRKFPHRYIESIKSLDECMLRSSREIREVFWVHFRDRFARLPDLPLQEFRSYLADLPHLLKAEAAGCEGLECKFRDVLKSVDLEQVARIWSTP